MQGPFRKKKELNTNINYFLRLLNYSVPVLKIFEFPLRISTIK